MDIDPGTASSQPSANQSAAQICLIRLEINEATRRPYGIDEKQFQDVAKAALVTLLFVFPLLWIVYRFQPPVLAAAVIPYLWFPVSACLALFVFSSAAVWFSRRA